MAFYGRELGEFLLSLIRSYGRSLETYFRYRMTLKSADFVEEK